MWAMRFEGRPIAPVEVEAARAVDLSNVAPDLNRDVATSGWGSNDRCSDRPVARTCYCVHAFKCYSKRGVKAVCSQAPSSSCSTLCTGEQLEAGSEENRDYEQEL